MHWIAYHFLLHSNWCVNASVVPLLHCYHLTLQCWLIASLVVQSIENLTRIHGKKCCLQLHQDGWIAALMVA
jgi:hypothetical protein